MVDFETQPSIEEAQQLSPVLATSISPSQFHAFSTSNEITIICNAPAPMVGSDGNLSLFARLSPQCLLRMSPQSAKDLYLVLKDNLEGYEKKYGNITTDFTVSRDGIQNV